MKKLSLKNLKLGADDMLQRNQLKAVFGGYTSNGTCKAYWPDASATPYYSAEYSVDFLTINGNRWDFTGMNAEDAETVALAKPGGRWCCDSCATASWLQ